MTDNPEHLEYNDRVGDLLREKEKPAFSWASTASLMAAIITVAIVGLVGAFFIGKTLFSSQRRSVPRSQIVVTTVPLPPAPEAVPVAPKPVPQSEPKTLLKETPKPEAKLKPKTEAKPVIKNAAPKAEVKAEVKLRPLSYKLILGSFETRAEAKAFQEALKAKGISTYLWVESMPTGMLMIYVQGAAFSSKSEAETAQKAFEKKGLSPFVLKR